MLLLAVRAGWTDDRANRAILRSEIEEALAEDPTHPVALSMRAELCGTSPVEQLRTSVAERPWDWRAWLLLAASLDGPASRSERIAAFRTAVALNPDSARAHSGLAWALVSDGRNEEALPYARRAMDLSPSDPNVLDALAFVQSSLGRCTEALQLQRRVVAVVGEDEVQQVLSRLHLYEEDCGDLAAVRATRGAVPGGAPASRR
jgi:tetratricopeptide (TPR) repeat protein